MLTTQPITPVILSGGSGTRLWPLSRAEQPKQFLALTDERTMFELTLARTTGLPGVTTPIVVGNAAHADLMITQGHDGMTLILEPLARNTAPAIALAAIALEEQDGAMLVMPSDHVISDVSAFHQAIDRARTLVAQGWLVTFGIKPDAPETGFGYIALGETLEDGVSRVERFVEKPDAARAREMFSAGDHVWNAGIFLFSARAYLSALDKHQKDMLTAARAAMTGANNQDGVIRPDAAAFAACPSDSIDYAVMEKADKVACAPVSMGWSDVGSWDALHELARKDETGNALHGASSAIDSGGCFVRSDGPHVTIVGANDLIVIASHDEVLILPRGRSQDVRKAVQAVAQRSNNRS